MHGAKFPDSPRSAKTRRFCFYDGGLLLGGINGNLYRNGLEIDTLWVDQNHRGRGYGRELMTAAEAYVRRHGAVIAFLKTQSATDYYRRLGYEVYAKLEDRPLGTVLFHMKKKLNA